MNQNYFIGVDISKSKIDCAVMGAQMNLISEKEVRNTDLKIKSYLLNVLKKQKIQPHELLVCCENTGIYNRPLERICGDLGITLWVEHPVKIKKASTDMRGKSDRKDALRIAEYAVRYQDKQIPYEEPTELIKKLNVKVRVREQLLNQKVAIENQLREAQSHDKEEYQILKESYKTALKSLSSSLGKLEKEIKELTAKDEDIAQNNQLMKSITGIGPQLALNFIISTNNFKWFSSANQLACYAGVVPFQNQSGTIIKRDRVSKMANLKLKKLLHMAAMAACRVKGELRTYYLRKVKEGKNKMSVINAVRNKLVHRIMAVITRKTPYIPL